VVPQKLFRSNTARVPALWILTPRHVLHELLRDLAVRRGGARALQGALARMPQKQQPSLLLPDVHALLLRYLLLPLRV